MKNTYKPCVKEYGRNIISQERKIPYLKITTVFYIDPFTLVLLSLALISFVLMCYLSVRRDRDFTAVIIVLIMVFLSGSLKFIQKYGLAMLRKN